MTPVLVTLALSKTHTVALPGRIYRRQGNHSIISLKACTEQCMLSFWWFFFFLPYSRLVIVIASTCVCHGMSLARTRCVCIYIYLTFCFWQHRQRGQNNLQSEFCSAAFLRLPLFAVFFFLLEFLSLPLKISAGSWHRGTREAFREARILWATLIHTSEIQKELLLCSGIIFLLCSDERSAEPW